MRRGAKPKIVETDDGKVLGVDLSSDFTAEHEWGIHPIREYFECDDKAVGLERRIIHTIPKGLIWVESEKEGGFAFVPSWSDKNKSATAKRLFNHGELVEYSRFSQPLRAAWSEGDFAIVSSQPPQIKQLKEVYDAFMKKDICILLGGREFLQNAGLNFAIASRLPKATTDLWKKQDEEQIKLYKEFDETGIEKLLEEKGKRYFALKPKYDKDGNLIFWLNPMDQHKHNFGWMTLQDLIDWSNDTGKVMAKK